MKIQKRILAFLTAALLLLPLTGCLVPKETDKTADPTASSGSVAAPDGAGDTSSAAFDGDAIAIELGDIQITAQELSDTFDQYVSYFYGYGMDEETLTQFLRMTEEGLIEYRMPIWKAKELGVTLSEEQEAECHANAQAEVDEERDMLLCYYGDPEGLVEDVSELTDVQRESALAEINSELEMMFGDGYTFDDYLAMRLQDMLLSYRIDAISALLEEQFYTDTPVDKAAIDEWYETTLAEQQERFTEYPEEYLDSKNGLELTETEFCLYVPAETAQLEIIYIPEDDSASDRLDEIAEKLSALEAEYGKLALSGENEERQAEIATEYAALKEENELLTAQHDGAAKEIADKAYADLTGGMTFAAAMDAYNAHDEDENGYYEWYVFLDGSETTFPELAKAAAKLDVGAYSEPIRIGDEYYIVRLAERIPAGAVDRASFDTLDETVSNTIRADLWEAQQDAWIEEAKNAAVYHRETYETLIQMYLG